MRAMHRQTRNPEGSGQSLVKMRISLSSTVAAAVSLIESGLDATRLQRAA